MNIAVIHDLVFALVPDFRWAFPAYHLLWAISLVGLIWSERGLWR